MDGWACKEQRGFIKGRCIPDNLLLLREAKWWINENKTPACFMSLDYSKAYDRVSWRFLWRCLEQYGFGPNYIRWIVILCEDAGACLLVNGDLSEWFELGRAARQGDPIAPLLFVFVEDFLVWSINRNPRIKGIKDPFGEEIKLSVLADDNLVMTDTEEETLEEVLAEVKGHGDLSGPELEKCVILLLNFQGSLPECLGNMKILGPGEKHKYLSIPLTLEDENDEIGVEIINRFSERAADLRVLHLSLAGRIIVLNMILESILWYFLFVWAPSDADKKRLKSVILGYLWNSPAERTVTHNKVTWEHLVLPVSQGGAGLVDPFVKAVALHGQWIVKAISPTPYPWKNYILHKLYRTQTWTDGQAGLCWITADDAQISETEQKSVLVSAIWRSWQVVKGLLVHKKPDSREEASSVALKGSKGWWKHPWRSKVNISNSLFIMEEKGFFFAGQAWNWHEGRWYSEQELSEVYSSVKRSANASLKMIQQGLEGNYLAALGCTTAVKSGGWFVRKPAGYNWFLRLPCSTELIFVTKVEAGVAVAKVFFQDNWEVGMRSTGTEVRGTDLDCCSSSSYSDKVESFG